MAKGADVVAARDPEPSGGAPGADRGEPGVGPDAARVVPGQVDDVVPAALYTAVARLLAFVYSLSPTAKMLGEVHRMAPGRLWGRPPECSGSSTTLEL